MIVNPVRRAIRAAASACLTPMEKDYINMHLPKTMRNKGIARFMEKHNLDGAGYESLKQSTFSKLRVQMADYPRVRHSDEDDAQDLFAVRDMTTLKS